jgi:DNA-binding transcriptional MerR regulator
MLETLEIPNKSMFKLNEVCGLTGVKPYVLRFWESEFTEIEPLISSSGQKLYEQKDIQAIALLKQMLFTEKMNIEQAKGNLPSRLGDLSGQHHQKEESTELKTFEEPPAFKGSSIQVERAPLSESDLDKLMMAKNLLREIVS